MASWQANLDKVCLLNNETASVNNYVTQFPWEQTRNLTLSGLFARFARMRETIVLRKEHVSQSIKLLLIGKRSTSLILGASQVCTGNPAGIATILTTAFTSFCIVKPCIAYPLETGDSYTILSRDVQHIYHKENLSLPNPIAVISAVSTDKQPSSSKSGIKFLSSTNSFFLGTAIGALAGGALVGFYFRFSNVADPADVGTNSPPVPNEPVNPPVVNLPLGVPPEQHQELVHSIQNGVVLSNQLLNDEGMNPNLSWEEINEIYSAGAIPPLYWNKNLWAKLLNIMMPFIENYLNG